MYLVGAHRCSIIRQLSGQVPYRQHFTLTFSTRGHLHRYRPAGQLTSFSNKMDKEHSSAAAVAPVAAGAASSSEEQSDLVQYIVLRADLWKEMGWPLGSIVAQACHAATAALWESREADFSKQYCYPAQLDHMHKVVLEIKGETQLLNLASKLQEASVQHKLWVEQPENFPTCLATAPLPKEAIQQHFKKLKLCKGS